MVMTMLVHQPAPIPLNFPRKFTGPRLGGPVQNWPNHFSGPIKTNNRNVSARGPNNAAAEPSPTKGFRQAGGGFWEDERGGSTGLLLPGGPPTRIRRSLRLQGSSFWGRMSSLSHLLGNSVDYLTLTDPFDRAVASDAEQVQTDNAGFGRSRPGLCSRCMAPGTVIRRLFFLFFSKWSLTIH